MSMSQASSNSMLLLPPSAFSLGNDHDNRSFTVHEQLEQLQMEMGRLRTNNEALKTAGRDLLERAPPLVNLPRRSNLVQETLEDIIQQQATEIDRLRNELEREKSRCLVAIDQLEEKLHNKELTWKAQLNEFEVRSVELQKVRKEKLFYEQLLTSQRQTNSTDDVQQKLSQQLEQRDRENAALNEEMRLLNLRLTSMNDVLTLQEEKLEQTSSSNQEKRQSLLNCWRTKVYDLLMQLKSMELVLKNNSSKFSTDIEQLQSKVNELLHENKLLQSQYDERKLHIQYLESKLNQSDSNVTSILNENFSLKQRVQFHENSEETIRHLMTKFAGQFQHDELFKTLNRTLAIYEQRLGYINKRFLVVQTLFNRQLAKISSKQQTTVAIQTEDEQYFDLNLLERELENVTRERDLLLRKFDVEFDQTQKQNEQIEEKYRQEIRVANEKFSLMQMIIDENQSKVELCERNLREKDQQLKDFIEKSVEEKQKRSENFDSVQNDFKEREEKLIDERDELEKQLAEAKREQAKLAANCRQIERTTTREKERWQRQLAESQTRSEAEIEKLNKRISTLERERNLLMKTIQHEKSISPQISSRDEHEIEDLVSQIRHLASRALNDSTDDENDDLTRNS